jgi:hypothetical protein
MKITDLEILAEQLTADLRESRYNFWGTLERHWKPKKGESKLIVSYELLDALRCLDSLELEFVVMPKNNERGNL